jgi:hypothetical protein
MYEYVAPNAEYKADDLSGLLTKWARYWVGAGDSHSSPYARASNALHAAHIAKNIGDFYAINSADRTIWDNFYQLANNLASDLDAIDQHPEMEPGAAAEQARERTAVAYSITTAEAAKRLGLTPGRVRVLAKSRRYGLLKGRDLFFTLAEVLAMRERKPGRPSKSQ